MSRTIVDDIVWWIPIKKIRDKARTKLYSKFFPDNNNITYEQLKRVTPQDFLYLVEINLAEHCNLHCFSCNHFSQLAKERYVSIESFENDIKRLYEITNGRIYQLMLLGGEPLLNKNINEYIKIIRKYFSNNAISIYTNGIMLLKKDEEFWNVCKENKIQIIVTVYDINIDIDAIEKKAKEYNIIFVTSENKSFNEKVSWKFVLDLNKSQDAFYSFINCFHANHCIHLKDGKLYTCPIIPNIEHFNKYFNKNLEVTELDYIDIYKAKDYNEILQFLAKPVPFCRYCDVKKWKVVGNWRRSNRDISEYIDE
ncbi:radical SAM protein [Brachyspira pilosicoli]|uniref:radical SAM protein n=2 Tax=Brachyspira pilosicoli TaxID=52584 RepID=UPI003005183F